MIIYLETRAKHYPQTLQILERFKSATVIEIAHYKNVFDKNTAGLNQQKSMIIAKLESPAITEAPAGYGHTSLAYFFKTSLNCIYDCSYCFLKGAFKTEHMVFFVNYDDIKKQIGKKIHEYSPSCFADIPLDEGEQNNPSPYGDSLLQRERKQEDIWFYSSDYSDIQGMDAISGFNNEFIEYFEQFDGVKMEIRTKSGNIKSLLNLGFVPKNTEVAFSLNPQCLIDQYETGTASLEQRIAAINTLLEAGFQVGIRLLPLLPVKNYQQIYSEFFTEISQKIDMTRVASSFASGLLFTKRDYNTMLRKYPDLDILHLLSLEDDDFYRESKQVRNWFYENVKSLDKKCMLCLEG